MEIVTNKLAVTASSVLESNATKFPDPARKFCDPAENADDDGGQPVQPSSSRRKRRIAEYLDAESQPSRPTLPMLPAVPTSTLTAMSTTLVTPPRPSLGTNQHRPSAAVSPVQSPPGSQSRLQEIEKDKDAIRNLLSLGDSHPSRVPLPMPCPAVGIMVTHKRQYTYRSRQKKEEKSQVKKDAKIWDDVRDIPVCGCEVSCLHRNFASVMWHVLEHHNCSAKLPYPDQKKKVLQYLSQHTDLTTKRVSWIVLGQVVCQDAWAAYYVIAESTLRSYKTDFFAGVNPDSVFHGNEGKKYRSPQRWVALSSNHHNHHDHHHQRQGQQQ